MVEYNAKVYRKQGGEELVVDSGGKITNAGTQASAITKLGATPTGTEIQTAVNAIIDALVGVGIIAPGA